MLLNASKFNYIYFLILLMPIALISGPFIPDLILSLIVIYFLFTNFNQLIIFFQKYIIIKILFLFCFTNIIVSLTSEDILHSLKNSLAYLRFPIFLIAITFFFKNNIKILHLFYYVCLIALILVCFDGIMQFINGKNLLGYVSNSRFRISGIFRDEFILGSYVARIMPLVLILYYFFYAENKDFKKKIIIVFVYFICLGTTIISGERSSLLIFLFFSFTYIFLVPRFHFRYKIYGVILLIFMGFFTIMGNESLKTRLITTTKYQLNSILNDTSHLDIGVYNNQHIKHLQVSFLMFQEKPIFGHGNKMFSKICYEKYYVEDGRCSSHPHNFAAQVLVENGLIGLTLFTTIIIIFTIYLFKSIQYNKNPLMISILNVIIFLIPIFPSGNFYNNRLSIYLYLALMIYFVLIETGNKSEKK